MDPLETIDCEVPLMQMLSEGLSCESLVGNILEGLGEHMAFEPMPIPAIDSQEMRVSQEEIQSVCAYSAPSYDEIPCIMELASMKASGPDLINGDSPIKSMMTLGTSDVDVQMGQTQMSESSEDTVEAGIEAETSEDGTSSSTFEMGAALTSKDCAPCTSDGKLSRPCSSMLRLRSARSLSGVPLSARAHSICFVDLYCSFSLPLQVVGDQEYFAIAAGHAGDVCASAASVWSRDLCREGGHRRRDLQSGLVPML